MLDEKKKKIIRACLPPFAFLAGLVLGNGIQNNGNAAPEIGDAQQAAADAHSNSRADVERLGGTVEDLGRTVSESGDIFREIRAQGENP